MKPRNHAVVWIAALAAAYFCAGKFSLSLAVLNPSVSPIWPPTGVALAALLLGGYRFWPGIFIGAFLVNITTQGSVPVALGIATGNTLEALLGALLVNQFAGGLNAFERAQTIFKYVVLAALLSTIVAASIGVTSLCLGGYATWKEYPEVWLTWWSGDAVGDLIAAQLLVVWLAIPKTPGSLKQILEGLALLLVLVWVGQSVFLGGMSSMNSVELKYLSFLPLLWAAFRFGLPGAAVSTLLMSGIALRGTLLGVGPYVGLERNKGLLLLQIFLGTTTITTLVLAALISERKKVEMRLQIRDAVNRALAEADTLATAAPKILEALCKVAEWEIGVIWTVNHDANEMVCVEFWHNPPLKLPEFEAITRQSRFAPGNDLPGRIWKAGQPIWLSNLTHDDSLPLVVAAMKARIHTVFAFPLQLNNEVLGVLGCFSRQARELDYDFLQMLANIGNQIGQFMHRHRSEQVTGESQRRFQQMAENIREVFWLTDVGKDKMVYISPAYEEIWGRTCESLYASPRTWVDALHPEDRERVLKEALTKQVSGEYDEIYRIIQPGGSIRWIHDRAFPVRDESGRVYRVAGIAEDITKRTEAEGQLTMLAHAVRNTAEMICTTDMEDRFTFVNDAFQQTYGYREKEILGKTPDIIFSSNNPPGLKEEILEQSRRSGWRGEVLNKKKDGTEFPVYLSTSPIVTSDGSIPGLMCVSRDISESRRTEAGLQRLATIIADSEDAIISTTLDGAIVTWNKAAQRIYGYVSEEAVGRPIGFVFPPGSDEKMSQLLENVVHGKKVASYETLCRRKDGSLFEISLTVSPVNDTAGKIMGASVIARDVSERRKMEREVLEISANERRRISFELHDGLSQHLAGVALKATSLRETLAVESPLHAEAMHVLVELLNDGMRQTRQVARNLDPTEVEASGLIAALERLSMETSVAYPVDCQFRCEESQLPLEGPANLALYRIAQEAIHNALVHGGADRIDLELAIDNKEVNLTVRDDGKGFDVSEKALSGMGLRLMQYRANAIDATFRVSSRPGAGTVVQCSLSLPFGVSESEKSPGQE